MLCLILKNYRIAIKTLRSGFIRDCIKFINNCIFNRKPILFKLELIFKNFACQDVDKLGLTLL